MKGLYNVKLWETVIKGTCSTGKLKLLLNRLRSMFQREHELKQAITKCDEVSKDGQVISMCLLFYTGYTKISKQTNHLTALRFTFNDKPPTVAPVLQTLMVSNDNPWALNNLTNWQHI